MSEHKFRAYLRSRQWSDNLLDFVDFAIDPTHDPSVEFPDSTSWEQLEAHLVSRKAPQHAIVSARHIWGLYEAEVLDRDS